LRCNPTLYLCQIVRRNQNLVTKHLDANNVRLLLRKVYVLPPPAPHHAYPEHKGELENGFNGSNGDGYHKAVVRIDDNAIAPRAQSGKARVPKAAANHLASIDLLTASMAEYNHDNKKRCRGGNPNLTLSLTQLQTDLYDRQVPCRVRKGLLWIEGLGTHARVSRRS
jgi:hypothetical protein